MANQAIDESLEKRLEYSYLYDFYGALLKEKNRMVLEDYLGNDYSLSEIARMQDMSRQAVYDIVKRSLVKLHDYEDKLGLVEKFRRTKSYAEEIRQLVESANSKEHQRIEELTNRILDDM